MFVVAVASSGVTGERATDILVIDNGLHDVEPVSQSVVNQNDVYNVNRMLVLPDKVSAAAVILSRLRRYNESL